MAGKKKQEVKSETTVEKNGSGEKTQTTTTTTTVEEDDSEPEKLDFDFDPNKQLAQAIEAQHAAASSAVRDLVDENARLTREKRRLEEDVNELRARLDAATGEAQAQRENYQRGLLQIEEHKNSQNSSQEALMAKLRDLQARLRRLAEDDKAKDKIIEDMVKQKEETAKYVKVLEGHVGPHDCEEIREQLAQCAEKSGGVREDMKVRELALRWRQRVLERSQVVRHDEKATKSAICVVM